MKVTIRIFVLLLGVMVMAVVGFTQESVKIKIDVTASNDINSQEIPKVAVSKDAGLDIIIKGYTPVGKIQIDIEGIKSIDNLNDFESGQDESGSTIYYILIRGNEVRVKGNVKKYDIKWPLKFSVKYDNKEVLSKVTINEAGPGAPVVALVELLKEPIPFHDARALAEAIEKKDDRILEILKKYTVQTLNDINDAKNAFEKNPFLHDYLQSVDVLKSQPVDTAVKKGSLQLQSLSTPSGFSPTKIADGLAKFLVERAKAELTIAFFQGFKDELNKQEILQTAFKETFIILKTIGEEIYNFPSYLQVLKEAFEKDLSNLCTNIPEVMDKGEIKAFFDKENNKWLKDLLKSAFIIIDGLKNEKHPGDILADFNIELDSDKSGNLTNAIKLLKIISKSLREKNDGGRYWIDKDSLNELFREENNQYIVLNLYLGLIYEQSKSDKIKFKIDGTEFDFTKELPKKVKEVLNKTQDVKKLFEEFIAKINNVEIAIERFKLKQSQANKNGQKLTYNDYYQAYNTVLDTIEYVSALAENIIKETDLDFPVSKTTFNENSKLKKFIEIARQLGDIYPNIKSRNYSSAIYKIIRVADLICQQSGNKSEDNPIFNNIRTKFLKYGAFMAAVANAENSDEVKKAIESVALPVGSYRIKRTRPFTISLNSYVGIHVGQEKYIGNTVENKEWIEDMSITAPIGLAFNKGLQRKGKCVSSLSLFVSIIDLGAIVRYRFEEEEKGLSEITWKDIFSPGVFLIWGPKNIPLSFGVGLQLAPLIEKVNDDGTIKRITPSRLRWGLMFGVDIPLIHFK